MVQLGNVKTPKIWGFSYIFRKKIWGFSDIFGKKIWGFSFFLCIIPPNMNLMNWVDLLKIFGDERSIWMTMSSCQHSLIAKWEVSYITLA